MDQPIIDEATLDGLRDTVGQEFLEELVEAFLEEAPRMLGDLRDAVAQDDADRYRRAAHSLKSNANTFGAFSLAHLAREAELTGMQGAADADDAVIVAIQAAFEAAGAALSELARG
jgi:HPt (histidine-containing phosphotransfer) domain-containing protein